MINYAIDAATLAGIFLIAGMGLYLLTGLTGQISLSQATYMGVGALVSSYCARSSLETSDQLPGLGMPFPQSLLIAALVTAALSALFGFAFIRLKGPAAISASIATSVLILYICERLTFLSGGSKGATSSRTLSFGKTNFADLTIGSHHFSREIGILILVVLCSAGVYLYTRNVTISPLGRAMRTIRERDQAAQTCAISPVRTIVSAYFLCGLAAGIAGTLYAHVLQSFEMSSSNPWLGPFAIIASMQLLAYLVVSGMKSLNIAVVVIFAMAFASNFFSRAASNIEIFDTAQGGRISPSHVAALVSSLLVLVILIVAAQRQKNRT